MSVPSSKPPSPAQKCAPSFHRIFVAQRVITEHPSKIITVALCTNCGEPFIHEHAFSGEVIAFENEAATAPPSK